MNVIKNPDIEDQKQYDGRNAFDFYEWSNGRITHDQVLSSYFCLLVKTKKKGLIKADPGDWVIKYKNGDIDVCKQEDLHETLYREEEETFEDELKRLINKHSKDSESNTPTWILANYLVACLDNFNESIKAREGATK